MLALLKEPTFLSHISFSFVPSCLFSSLALNVNHNVFDSLWKVFYSGGAGSGGVQDSRSKFSTCIPATGRKLMDSGHLFSFLFLLFF